MLLGLNETVKTPPVARVLDVSIVDEEILKIYWDVNNYVNKDLFLSIVTMTDEQLMVFHIIAGSVTTDLPDGDVALA